MRKLLTGALLLATAVAVQLGVSTADVSAATATTNSIAATAVTIDYANQTLTVAETTAKDLEIGFAIATVKSVKDKSTGKTTNTLASIADSAWEWYDNNGSSTKAGSVVIDLSTLSNTKDNYIQIKGDKLTDPLTIMIPAVTSKVKGTYNGYTGVVTLTDTTDKTGATTLDGLEYRTQYSGWTAYTPGTTDLSKYAYRGATLTFRETAAGATKLSAVTTDDITIPGTTIYYTGASFPGKEVKVKITKLANAPKVTADYVNRVFKLPANCEYRITKSGASTLGTWTEGAAKASTLAADLSTAGTIEVRTKADATKGKAASKIGKLTYAAQGTVTVTGTVSSKTVTSGTAANNTKLLTNDVSLNQADTDVTCAYDAKKTGVTITNGTSAVYQVVISDTTDIPASTAKATKIAAGKSVTVKAAEGQYVFIRQVGDAKTGVWSTEYIGLGIVKKEDE